MAGGLAEIRWKAGVLPCDFASQRDRPLIITWTNLADSSIFSLVTSPETGWYTFWIAGDDATELSISTDDRKFLKRRVSYVGSDFSFENRTTGPGNVDASYDTFPSQRSVPIHMEAGHQYYIEALHKDSDGTL